MKLPLIDQADVAGKRVFVRGDIDVPLIGVRGSLRLRSGQAGFRVQGDTRLNGILPTIEYLLSRNCRVILAGHLGRPGGKVVPELSSKPVADWIRDKVGDRVQVLENLRFDPREEANDEEYAKELAGLAEVYVNEAFAASEREHASIVGVPKYLPHFAGFRLAKELEVLSTVLENPKRPLVVVIGGAKPETKLPLITKMKLVADTMVTKDDLAPTPGGWDVTLDSIEKFADRFSAAGTILWNGPVGKIEEIPYQVGTRKMAELIAGSSAYKIVGGGDTVAFLDKLGLTSRFDWVSSGGGSMLRLLAGEELPGVAALFSQ